MATPAGPYPSYASSTIVSPSSSPVPFLTARSMLTLGMFASFAVSIASRSRGLPSGSPPPALAATVISRISLVHAWARRLSVTAFFRLICFHLLCPAIIHLFGSGPKISSGGRVAATCAGPLDFRPYAFPASCGPRRRPAPRLHPGPAQAAEPPGRLRDPPHPAGAGVPGAVGERGCADVHLPERQPGGLGRGVLRAHLRRRRQVPDGEPEHRGLGGARLLRGVQWPPPLGPGPARGGE